MKGVADLILASKPVTFRYCSNCRKSVLGCMSQRFSKRPSLPQGGNVMDHTYSERMTPELKISLAKIVPNGLIDQKSVIG